MAQMKELLAEELQDLLHAEGQLVEALPKMAQAAHHPKLKEAFQKHLAQTEGHVQRLKKVFELLGEKAHPKACRAMMGLIEEGRETIDEGKAKDPMIADLALVAAAQRVEHYEIAAYGNVKCLARLAGEIEAAQLLSQTLGEEEAADHMLTMISAPILQEAVLSDPDVMEKKTGSRETKKPNLYSVASEMETVATSSRAHRG
jgi:Mn-containing catalase